MGICEDRITEDSTEFEKAFLKIYDGSLWTTLDKMKDWQPPKPLVKVPQIVADWFESAKGNLEFEIWQYISDWRENEQNDFWFWFSEDRNKPTETLIRMKLEGYTVKKEQLYEVVFSKCQDGDRYLLFANIEFFIGIESMNDGYYRQQFTEAEIKEIDERYLAFAVPV